MKSYITKSITLRYDQPLDRIQWLCTSSDNELVIIWLTRRMLIKLAPKLSQWLEKPLPTDEKLRTPMEREAISRFRHEAAVKKSIRRKVTIDVNNMTDFMLHAISFRTVSANQHVFTITDSNKTKQIKFVASYNDIHRILGELISLAKSAEWGVDLPWSKMAANLPQNSVKSMH